MSTQQEQETVEIFCYGINGDEVIDGPKAFAKIEGNRYYVKEMRIGPEAGHLVNPWSMWYQDAYSRAAAPGRGQKAVEYRKVGERCFELYLRFLETRNNAFYRNAERTLD